MNEQNTDSKRKVPDASWNPVVMSVFVYPGVGQWMQKRQTAGSLYVTFFTVISALFLLTFYRYMREVIPIIQQAFETNFNDELSLPPLTSILKPFTIVLFIYAGNVVDVLRGRMQLLRSLKEDKE